MATYTNPTTLNNDPDDPLTSEWGEAAIQNPLAIAEGASGAPTVEVAWHLLETLTPTVDGTTFALATDVSAYRAIRLAGVCKIVGATSSVVSVQINHGGGWRTILTTASANAHAFDVEVNGVDNADSEGIALISGQHATGLALDRSSNTVIGESTGVLGYSAQTGVVSAIRITSAGLNFDAETSGDEPIFRLFGIKRTLA